MSTASGVRALRPGWVPVLMVVALGDPVLASQPDNGFRYTGTSACVREIWAEFDKGLPDCARLADLDGVFGDVVVHVAEYQTPVRLAITVSRSLQGRVARCLQTTLARARQTPGGPGCPSGYALASRPPRGSASRDFPVGRPRAFLPPFDALAPTLAGTESSRSSRAALRRTLSADVAIDEAGCLLLPATDNYRTAFQLWLDSSRRAVDRRWEYLFRDLGATRAERGDHLRAGRAIARTAAVWSSPFVGLYDYAALAVPPAQRFEAPDRLCARRITDGTRREIGDGVERAGRCWKGDLDAILREPEISVPGRGYVALDASAQRACAIDRAGAVECCGTGTFTTAPPGPFVSVSAGTRVSCAIRRDQSWSCWGQRAATPPGAPPQAKDVSAAFGWICLTAPDGEASSWHDGRRVTGPAEPRRPLRQIVAGIDGCCGLAQDGEVSCWNDTATRRRSTPLARIEHVDPLCGLRRDGTPWCEAPVAPTGALPARPFASAVFGPAGGCGATRSEDRDGRAGQIECWGQHGARSPAVGTVRTIRGIPGSYCALYNDGAVPCWGDGWPRGRLSTTTDVSPQ